MGKNLAAVCAAATFGVIAAPVASGGFAVDHRGGEGTVVIPNIIGLSEDRAWARLRTLGLQPVSVPTAPRFEVGQVAATAPRDGTEVANGIRVALAVTDAVPEWFLTTVRPWMRRVMLVGLSCPGADPIGCDDVGVAVWPTGAVHRMIVRINHRRVAMHPTTGGYWEGRLRNVGIVGRVRAARGSTRGWAGSSPMVNVDAVLFVQRRQGTPLRAVVKQFVVVRPGWG